MIKVSAPGKIHLLGEHAVVFGKPAILAAIDKRCGVKVIPSPKPPQPVSKEFDLVGVAIEETFKFLKVKKPLNFDLQINSEIPVGVGLGSSAAAAVCVVGALLLLLGKKLDKEIINIIAYEVEKKVHGFPSGGDNSTVTYGGLVWYRKESEDLKIIKPLPFFLPKNWSENFVLIDTGRPKETTGEMVMAVKKLVNIRPKWTERIFNHQEKLVKKLLEAIKNGNEKLLMETIRNGERNLEKLGVVSKFTRDLIRDLETMGAAAKICGAGGEKDKSGIVLVFHKEPKKLIDFSRSLGLDAYQVRIGEDGVRIEN